MAREIYPKFRKNKTLSANKEGLAKTAGGSAKVSADTSTPASRLLSAIL
jgi:hypothetical protein